MCLVQGALQLLQSNSAASAHQSTDGGAAMRTSEQGADAAAPAVAAEPSAPLQPRSASDAPAQTHLIESSEQAGGAISATAPPATAPPAKVAKETEQLGMTPEQWRAQSGGHKAVEIAGVPLSAVRPVPKPSFAKQTEAEAPAVTSDADAPEAFTGRNTKVLLPVSPEVEVSNEVFKRTGAELRRDFMKAKERREQSEQLMTRAMREKLASKKKTKTHLFARIRVRFPEGLTLQGASAALIGDDRDGTVLLAVAVRCASTCNGQYAGADGPHML